MKLDKAIEILRLYGLSIQPRQDLDFENAIKLGIEALKRIQADRFPQESPLWTLLPGEDPPDTTTPSPDQIKRLQESPIGEK